MTFARKKAEVMIVVPLKKLSVMAYYKNKRKIVSKLTFMSALVVRLETISYVDLSTARTYHGNLPNTIWGSYITDQQTMKWGSNM